MSKNTAWSRRAFLGGAGAALALPFLRGLPTRTANAAPGGRPVRLLVLFTPNGMNMRDWTPAQAGADYALSPILQPLAPIRDEVLVLSGIDNRPAETEGFGQHAPATAAFLTCTNVQRTEALQNAISMDQVAANALGGATRFASLQLGTHGGVNAGGCDGGYSCAYLHNISWAGRGSPMPKLINPQAVFDLMFAGFDPDATAEEIARRRLYKKSVLDGVLDEAASIHAQLGYTGQHKLDQYMTGVRELEQRVGGFEGAVCPAGDRPAADANYPARVRLMLDLMALAVQCDLTRIVTFMMGNSISGQPFPFIGVNDGHHGVSHHQNDPTKLAQLTTIDRWEIEQLSYLLQKLAAIEDGDGTTLLDNSLVYLSNEVADGNAHVNRGLPVLLAGRGGGAIAPGRHVRYNGAKLADLYIAMLGVLGVTVDRFGDDGTAPLGGLA